MNVSISGASSSSWANQAQMASQGEARLERLFNKFDSDGDGTISKSELETAKANCEEGSRDAKLLESLTADDSGGVSLEDFKTQVKAQMEQMRGKGQAGGPPSGPPPDAAEMFSKVDANGDGSLDKSELEEMAAGGPQGGPSASKMIDEMDTNKDGTVSQAEFQAHMEKMQSRMMSSAGGQTSGEQSADGTVSSSYSSEQLASLLLEALKSYQQNESGAWSLLTDSDGSSTSSGGVYV